MPFVFSEHSRYRSMLMFEQSRLRAKAVPCCLHYLKMVGVGPHELESAPASARSCAAWLKGVSHPLQAWRQKLINEFTTIVAAAPRDASTRPPRGKPTVVADDDLPSARD
jgi:hypothetical protein